MKSLGLGDVEDFPFLDPPHRSAIAEGYRVLEELGALDDERELTPLGEQLARFPVDPRIGRMILAGAEPAACARCSSSPRRSTPGSARASARGAAEGRRGCTGGSATSAPTSSASSGSGTSSGRRSARARSQPAARLQGELPLVPAHARVGRHPPAARGDRPRARLRAEDAATRPSARADERRAPPRAPAPGSSRKIGMWNPEKRVYMGAKQTRFAIHPSSALARKPPAWVMAFELVETSQLFARTAAKIEPEWLLEAAPHLLQAQLLRSALVREVGARVDARSTSRCSACSIVARPKRGLRERRAGRGAAHVPRSRARARRVHDARRVPCRRTARSSTRSRASATRRAGATCSRTTTRCSRSSTSASPTTSSTARRSRRGARRPRTTDPRVLAPLAWTTCSPASARALARATIPTRSRCTARRCRSRTASIRRADDDGITLTVPLVLLPQLDPGELDWTIPGWHEEKIAALLDELPRAHASRARRRDPGARARARAASSRRSTARCFRRSRERSPEITGVDVPEDGVSARCGRGVPAAHVPRRRRRVARSSRRAARRRRSPRSASAPGARRLEEQRRRRRRGSGRGSRRGTSASSRRSSCGACRAPEVRSYPALVDRGTSVDLVLARVVARRPRSRRAAGVRRLLMLAARRTLSAVAPRTPAGVRSAERRAAIARGDAMRSARAVLARIVDAGLPARRRTRRCRARSRHSTSSSRRDAPRIDPRLPRSSPRRSSRSATELDKTLAALRNASKHPSGRAALVDI